MSEQDGTRLNLPSYDEALQDSHSEKQSMHLEVQSQIRDELADLAIRFSAAQAQRHEELQRNDRNILEVLLRHTRDFLRDYTKSALPKATLILVPDGELPKNAVDALDDLRDKDDFGRLVQVSKGKGDGTASSSWSGEDMTKRLARSLRPAPAIAMSTTGPEAQAVVSAAAEKSRSRWWKRSSPIVGAASLAPSKQDGYQLPRIAMSVSAEEVDFRAEDKFGAYSTVSVWGLVIKLRINAENIS